MRYHVLTLFPEMIDAGLDTSIIGRAKSKGILYIDAVNIRDFTQDPHGKTDDYPYGGGAGMVMSAQPVYDAWRHITQNGCKKARVICPDPKGRTFDQKMAKELAKEDELIFLCGHYEGIDERVLKRIVTDRVSIGDYVLTGGELAAMVMIDAIARLIPGVLHNEDSAAGETFEDGLLEYPQYTRPAQWEGMEVPEILLSGDHERIADWRHQMQILSTLKNRPDLLAEAVLDLDDLKKLL